MKYPVTRFKSMDVALKEMEPFVKDAAPPAIGETVRQIRQHALARDCRKLVALCDHPSRR